MGRVIRREVVALRCELRSCDAVYRLRPLSLYAEWYLQREQLRLAVIEGWGLVLTPQLRSYCPAHVSRVSACTCRTNPDRRHLCVAHDASTHARVWLRADDVPQEAYELLHFDDAVAA